MRLALLLALLLPLQSFAGVGCSSPHAASVAAHQHCHDAVDGAQSGDLAQHHHCGSCCVGAVAATPLRFTPPSVTNPGISLPVHQPLLKVALDRLDRPPRLIVR